MSKSGPRQPLYVVHGAGGGILFLEEFARRLEGIRPVFGFRAHGLDGSVPPDLDVDSVVSRYVGELCESSPGPYLLGGYSSGGRIAVEMASRLKSMGRDVSRVVLFDCWPTGASSAPRMMRHVRLLRYLMTDGYEPVRPFVQFILGNRLRKYSANPGPEVEDPPRDDVDEFFWRTLEFVEKHPFSRHDVDAVLIKAELNWPALPRDYGWQPYLSRPLDIRVTRGHHITMWWPEHVSALIDLVEDILEEPSHTAKQKRAGANASRDMSVA